MVLKKISCRKNILKLLLEHDLENAVKNCWKSRINLLSMFLKVANRCDEDAVEVVTIILNYRLSSINEYDVYGSTSLNCAICRDMTDMVSFLLDNGADPCLPDKIGIFFPLLYAILGRNEEIVVLLTSHGANVDERFSGHTFLHLSCCKDMPNAIRSLIKNGVDVCARSHLDGRTPLGFLERNDLVDDDESLLIVLKELSRLNFENRSIPHSDMEWIREHPKVQEYFNNCMNELEVMSKTAFWGSQTVYSFLKMTSEIKKLSNLTNNEDHIRKVLDSIFTRFPNFQSDLNSNLEEDMKVWNDTLIVESKLKPIFKGFLPNIVIEKVSQHLSVKDVRW